MKSPFPGMDPYLERHWGDVDQGIVTYIRDWIQSRLPADLRARMQERIYIEIPDVRRGEYYPDVRVIERPRRSPAVGSATAVAEPSIATEVDDDRVPVEPILIHLDIEPITKFVNSEARRLPLAAISRFATWPEGPRLRSTSIRRPLALGQAVDGEAAERFPRR